MIHDFINVFYNGDDADNFGAMLFRLIRKADADNRALLKKAFPQEVMLFEWWRTQDDAPSREEVEEMVKIIGELFGAAAA
jgi:hypothetical protein